MQFPKLEPITKGDSQSGAYLKLDSGQSVIAVLRGELHSFWIKWEDGKSIRTVEGTPGAKARFSVNAIVSENGKMVPKTWEFGRNVYDQLAEIHETYPLNTLKVKISRSGTGLDTVYRIMPLLRDEDKLSIQTLALLNKVELNILNREPKASHEAHDNFAPPADEPGDNWGGF